MLLRPTCCLGQAMGKASVDVPAAEPAPAASPRAAEVLKATPALVPASAAPAAARPSAAGATASAAGNSTGSPAASGGGAEHAANLTPAALPKAESAGPVIPATVTGSLPAAPSAAAAAATAPAVGGEATTAPAAAGAVTGGGAEGGTGVVHRAIESMPIRPAGAAPVPAAGDTPPAKTASSGLGGLGSAVQVGGALAIVLGLIWIGRTLARKYLPGAAASGGKGVMEILARYPLAKNQSLVLVRIGSQIVVLNQGREASQSVLVISEPTEVANILGQIQGTKPQSIQAGFSKLLANARVELESGEEEEAGGAEANRVMSVEDLDRDLDEMAAAKRQLMDLRAQVRSVRENLPLR